MPFAIKNPACDGGMNDRIRRLRQQSVETPAPVKAPTHSADSIAFTSRSIQGLRRFEVYRQNKNSAPFAIQSAAHPGNGTASSFI